MRRGTLLTPPCMGQEEQDRVRKKRESKRRKTDVQGENLQG